ncbi:Serpin B10 [Frankliniella fusca]|uniref:Serpin B10 n=1 Tax=Frankliniella fusca TaxID=407009 RepID=A0AAE1LNU6_9NEOP|nr:Serpin B10 [Frankliniella fusca]
MYIMSQHDAPWIRKVIIMMLLTCVASSTATLEPTEPLAAVVKSVNDFSLDLYLKEAEIKGPGENILLSPLSAFLVTAMVHAGAEGLTKDEITKALRYPRDGGTLEKGFMLLHNLLQNTPNVTLETANRVYVEENIGKKIKSNFQETIIGVHKSELLAADFQFHAEEERISINEWVSNKTQQKIVDLIPPGMVNHDTIMVLINAVYFHGEWKKQFSKKQTSEDDFYITNDQTKTVKMMFIQRKLKYANIPKLDAQAVELSYKNENFCLQIILPNSRHGLEALQKKLSDGFDLSNIDFKSTLMILHLPKFKLAETVDIKSLYQKMGVTSMFQQTANFSGMFDNASVHVSDAIQKTFMEVDERGTMAGAASSFKIVNRMMPSFKKFKVDHPYMVRLIMRNLSGESVTLFIGSVYNPN